MAGDTDRTEIDRIDLEGAGGLASSMNATARRTRRTVRETIPERYRETYREGVGYVGLGLALLVVLVSAYVLLDTAFLAVAPLLGFSIDTVQYTVAIRILGFVVLALAWDLVGGQMGYASFGNMAFFGIGVYVVVVFLNGTTALGTQPFWVALAVAAGLSLAFGLVVGYPLLRLRGHYFAIATLGVLVATQQLVANLEQTGGGSGMTVPNAGFESVDRTFYLLYLGLAAATMLTYWYLTRSRFGHGLNAIRDDETKARAMGLHTTKYKILAWAISAVFTGLAGALFAVHSAYVNPSTAFQIDWTVLMILMALAGGMGRLWGPVIGAAFLWQLRNTLWSNPPMVQRLSDLTGIPLHEAYLVVFGLLLVFLVVGAPEGILGYVEEADAFDPVRRRAQGTPLESFVNRPRNSEP